MLGCVVNGEPAGAPLAAMELAICVVAPAFAVSLKVSGLPVNPVAVAVMVLTPAVVPSVQEPGDARPFEFVVVVSVVPEPPPEATAKVTETPGTLLLLASTTNTVGTVPTAVPTVDDWLFPA